MDATAIIVALIIAMPAVLTLLNQRSMAKLAREDAALQKALLEKVATQESLDVVAVKTDGKMTALQAELAAVQGELRRLKADPTASTPATGGLVNLAEETGAVTVDRRNRHDDPPGIDIRAGEQKP